MTPIPEAPVPSGCVLAVPLRAAGRRARLLVHRGDSVLMNQTLAVSESGDGADVCAPVCGEIMGIAARKIAAPAPLDSECVLLRANGKNNCAPPLAAATPREMLRAAGISGLGGASFPAWRKWREGVKYFIVNAAESDSAVSCDAALMREMGNEFIQAVARVARALNAENTVIAAPDSERIPGNEFIRWFSVPGGDLAAGSERMLIRAIAGADIIPPQIPADFGVLCHNAATVAAMDAALSNGVPMTRRIVTVRENGTARNIRVPFGVEISQLAEDKKRGKILAGGRRAREFCGSDAIAGAATNAVEFPANGVGGDLSAACVRCGACLPSCPVDLNPMRLHFLTLDSRLDDLRAENISHCLECARCDDVCPSRIPLARALGLARDAVLREDESRRRADILRRWHERHLSAAKMKSRPRRASAAEKSAALDAALKRAGAPMTEDR